MATGRMEAWAGVECALVRVGDGICDQLALTGHDRRLGDVDLLSSLGVAAVRYPLLWERTEGRGPGRLDWRWGDARVPRLAELGIRPILGLLHHGAGPSWTSFLDPSFPAAFARYAGAVAARYPFVDAYLPINEPLTTARFAGLYGFWWPHERAWETFARILLAQCLATRDAMAAIREVNPAAKLLQNEDLGRTWSTPELAEQAAADNERRWLTFDLLSGRVRPGHAFWEPLSGAGLRAKLESLAEQPCPPDLMGVDYYVTSDRFLDHDVEVYPEWAHGGNDRIAYADVEAVRSRLEWTSGFGRAIDDAWERYATPIVLAEVQLAGDPEDQCLWWAEAWEQAAERRAAGVDVRAVTAWSAFGAWEWPSLLRRRDNAYEAGPFDARTHAPRPTMLAGAILASASGEPRGESMGIGWWRRDDRARYGVTAEVAASSGEHAGPQAERHRRPRRSPSPRERTATMRSRPG